MRIHESVWFKIVDDYEFYSSFKKLLERLLTNILFTVYKIYQKKRNTPPKILTKSFERLFI